MRNIVVAILFLSLIGDGALAQTSKNVCVRTSDIKPYFINPLIDTFSSEQLLKAPLLQTGYPGVTVVSFQISMGRDAVNDFPNFFVIGRSVRVSEFVYRSLKAGKYTGPFHILCVQAKDSTGRTLVLQNRKYYINQ